MKISNWIMASRLPSQSYIFFPLLFGQGLSVRAGFDFDWCLFVLTHIYGILIQLYIVYANDLADQEIDKKNTTFNIFSGGSRVLVNNLISVKNLERATLLTIMLNFFLGLWLAFSFQRPWFMIFLLISWFLLWAYSYLPFKLSYRGGGEFLQMIGVGLVLPLVGFYNQSGSISTFPWKFTIILFPIHLAAAMTTSIPDEPSDKLGLKRTSSVILGSFKVKITIMLLYIITFVLFLFTHVLNWPVTVKLSVLSAPFIFMLLASRNISNSPAGTKRSDHFVALMVASVVLFMVGLSIAAFTNEIKGF